jgi:NAD kinase
LIVSAVHQRQLAICSSVVLLKNISRLHESHTAGRAPVEIISSRRSRRDERTIITVFQGNNSKSIIGDGLTIGTPAGSAWLLAAYFPLLPWL